MDAAGADPIQQLAAAVHADDVSRVRQVLAQQPDLTLRLDQPLPAQRSARLRCSPRSNGATAT